MAAWKVGQEIQIGERADPLTVRLVRKEAPRVWIGVRLSGLYVGDEIRVRELTAREARLYNPF